MSIVAKSLLVSYCFDIGTHVDRDFLTKNFYDEYQSVPDNSLDTDVFNTSFLNTFSSPVLLKRGTQGVKLDGIEYTFQWSFFLINGILNLLIHIQLREGSVDEQVRILKFIDEQHYACYYHELSKRDIATKLVQMVHEKRGVLRDRVVHYIEEAFKIKDTLRAKISPIRDYGDPAAD